MSSDRKDPSMSSYTRMMLAANELMDKQCVSKEHRERVQRALDKVEEELERHS